MNIKVFSPDIRLLGEIDFYTSLIMAMHYNEIGDFEINTVVSKQNLQLFKKNNLIMIDNKKDRVGIIKHREIDLDEEGKEILKIKGFTLDVILNKRICYIDTNEEETVFGGNSIELIEKLLNDNLINPKDKARKIDNLIIEGTDIIGTDIIWQIESNKKVGDTISEICKINSLGYKVYIDFDKKKIVFKLYKGKDLPKKVVFSPDLDNIFNMKYVDNNIEEKNVVYIRIDNDSIIPYCEEDLTGIDRIETFLYHGEVKDNENVDEIGKNELSKYPQVESIEGDIDTNNSLFKYEKDYNLGDVVTLRNNNWGIEKDLRITSITEIYEGTPKVKVVFGEPQPTFVKKIKNYITNIK